MAVAEVARARHRLRAACLVAGKAVRSVLEDEPHESARAGIVRIAGPLPVRDGTPGIARRAGVLGGQQLHVQAAVGVSGGARVAVERACARDVLRHTLAVLEQMPEVRATDGAASVARAFVERGGARQIARHRQAVLERVAQVVAGQTVAEIAAALVERRRTREVAREGLPAA